MYLKGCSDKPYFLKLNSTGILNCTDLYDDVVFIRNDGHVISNNEKYEIIDKKILQIKNIGRFYNNLIIYFNGYIDNFNVAYTIISKKCLKNYDKGKNFVTKKSSQIMFIA